MNTITKDRVSIITIVLNGEKYIEQTILSVLNQENVKIEYIVIDGGSKDSTLQIIEKYKSSIHIFLSEPDNGIYDALNKGIKLATGSLIGIIHCGDFYSPNAVSLAFNEYLKTGADIIYGNMTIIEKIASHTYNITKTANHLKLGNQMSIFHPASFISHECYDKYGIYDTKYKITADYELFLRYFEAGLSFAYINYPLAFFRIGGVSGTNIKTLLEENILIRKEHMGQLKALKFALSSISINAYKSFRKIIILSIIGNNNFNKLKNLYRHPFK